LKVSDQLSHLYDCILKAIESQVQIYRQMRIDNNFIVLGTLIRGVSSHETSLSNAELGFRETFARFKLKRSFKALSLALRPFSIPNVPD
jgi:hypothetical protein